MAERGKPGGLAVLVGLAFALAALSLLWAHTLTYDAWSWAIWGHQALHLSLDTGVGPSWKPLPVAVDAVFALFGRAAEPALWLVLARAVTALGVVFAFRLARRLGGWPAGAFAALAYLAAAHDQILFGVFQFAGLGWSEGLVATLALAAIDRHLDGRRGQALALAEAACLMRPEGAPLLALYAAWLWRADPALRLWSLAALALLPVAWLAPDVIGGGGFGRVSARAHHEVSAAVARASRPSLAVAEFLRDLLITPVKVLALAGVVLAWRRRDRGALALAAIALAWLAIVAVMAEMGYAAVPRYLVVTVALAIVLAGAGFAWLAELAPRGAPHALALAALAAISAPFLAGRLPAIRGELRSVRFQTAVDHDIARAVSRAGGSAAVRRCGVAATNPFEVPALSWSLGAPRTGVTFRSAPAATVFRTRAYAGGPVVPAPAAGLRRITTAGHVEVYSRCAALAASAS
jgi:hypothetical protein